MINYKRDHPEYYAKMRKQYTQAWIGIVLSIVIWAIATSVVLAESSNVSGSGPLSASASIDFRIIIPPKCWIDDEGNIQTNWKKHSGYKCDLEDEQGEMQKDVENGVLTLSNP